MKHEGYSYLADAVAVIMTAVQTDKVFQYISLALTIIATLGSIMITILKLIKWWKDATQDGKITEDEIDEAIHIVSEDKEKGKEKK